MPNAETNQVKRQPVWRQVVAFVMGVVLGTCFTADAGTNITFNGTSYTVPSIGDASWGTAVSTYLIAISNGALQKSGGSFTLTGEVDFGSTYGLKAPYFKSKNTVISNAGVLRLGTSDAISWRNAANNANLPLLVDGNNNLLFNANQIYTNAATVSANGYLSSTDWGAFNAKQPAGSYVTTSRNVNTTSPLAGGGTLASDLTLSIPVATVSTNGYLASTDWATFNSVVSKVPLTRNISTTSPLAGGGTLASDLTLSMPAATVSANGYLTSTDWTTFNSKQASGSYALQATAINTTSPLTGGGNLSTSRTFGIIQSGSTSNGYLSSADWTTFNGKQAHSTALDNFSGLADGSATQVLSTLGSGSGYSWASALSSTLNQYNVSVGNASNAATAVNTNLLGDVAATTNSQSYTVTSASPGVFTVSTAPATGDKAYVTATQNGFTANTTYYAHNVSGTTFQLCTTLANAVVGGASCITSSGTTAGTVITGGFKLGPTSRPGVFDGSAQTTGYIGEYLEGTCTANTNTASDNTYVDITGATITLTPGVWMIGYHATFDLSRSTGTPKIFYNMRSGSSTETANTFAWFGYGTSDSSQASTLSVSTVVNITSATTYKLSGQTSDNTNSTLLTRCNNDTAHSSTAAWGLRIR